MLDSCQLENPCFIDFSGGQVDNHTTQKHFFPMRRTAGRCILIQNGPTRIDRAPEVWTGDSIRTCLIIVGTEVDVIPQTGSGWLIPIRLALKVWAQRPSSAQIFNGRHGMRSGIFGSIITRHTKDREGRSLAALPV